MQDCIMPKINAGIIEVSLYNAITRMSKVLFKVILHRASVQPFFS